MAQTYEEAEATIQGTLLFVDMNCTALAFDGKHLHGCARSYMALNTGYNFVPPRRLHKYNERGFASLIPGGLMARAKILQAEEIRSGLRFLDIDWFDDSGAMVDAICANTGRLYCETNLPRGFGIAAAMTDAILERLQAQARATGRSTSVKKFDGAPTGLVFKAAKTPENWVRWGLI